MTVVLPVFFFIAGFVGLSLCKCFESVCLFAESWECSCSHGRSGVWEDDFVSETEKIQGNWAIDTFPPLISLQLNGKNKRSD